MPLAMSIEIFILTLQSMGFLERIQSSTVPAFIYYKNTVSVKIIRRTHQNPIYCIYLVKRIILVPKIGVATVQTRPPFNTGKQFVSHHSHNQLWAPLSVVLTK